MNLLYMGYFCNEGLFDRLVESGSKSSHARQQLETKLLNGLIEVLGEKKLEMISYLPLMNKDIVAEFGKDEIYRGVNVRYLWCDKQNIFSLLQAFYRNLIYIRQWAAGKESKVVLTYSSNPLHVIPLLLLKKIYKIKIVTLCSEVSDFRRKEGISFIGRISRKVSSFLENSFDGYVLLSKYMNEVINKKCRPYIVMEGIAGEVSEEEEIEKKYAVLYAGGLTEDNGIMILLDGFVQAAIEGLELWICGDGPLINVVKKYDKQYRNIHYYGVISNQYVQRMEREAELLIAPRISKNHFTKYSFPSKTIEYMASGTPTVLTRLKGIPKEYFDYTYVLEDETVEGISGCLREIFHRERAERKEFGKKAQKFVLENKNSYVQAEKILHFLKNEYGKTDK